jgi:sugar/nucleoside kinase (ribokinase family)
VSIIAYMNRLTKVVAAGAFAVQRPGAQESYGRYPAVQALLEPFNDRNEHATS